jgi:hypothetical protein
MDALTRHHRPPFGQNHRRTQARVPPQPAPVREDRASASLDELRADAKTVVAQPSPWPTREYLTVAELADLLSLTSKTVRNRMHDGTWRRGEHWFHPPGIGPRFRWSAIRAWFESDRPTPPRLGAAYGSDIPPPRRGQRSHRSLT